MDSKIKRLSKCILLLAGFFVPWCAIYFSGNEKIAYAVYLNDNPVAYVKDKRLVENIYENTVNELKDKVGEVKTQNHIEYKKTLIDKEDFSDENSIKENINSSINKSVDVVLIKVDEKNLGVLENKEKGEELISRIKDYYIEKHKISRDSIISIKVKNNISYIPYNTSVSEVNSVEDLYKGIMEVNHNKPMIDVEIVYKTESTENINQGTTITNSDELFMGESKVKDPGEAGKKSVEKEITLKNSTIISEKKIKEKIISNPQNKIVVNGTKNPVGTNVAFLSKPSRGAITSNFGSRWQGESHHGVDIAGNVGDPVSAALEGTVNKVGYDNIYGNYIKVDHGKGVETLYGHLSKVNVSINQKVKKGDTIGKVGNTGRSTGPHLHFELRLNGIAQNPMAYIK